jgi:hypothetical protein
MFGSGLVVCLAKFSEHLENSFVPVNEHVLQNYVRWTRMNEQERERVQQSALTHPHGDDARFLESIWLWISSLNQSPEEIIHHLIEMWMHAASDHFYDLDRDRAPACLVELADLALDMGHGFECQQKDAKRRLWTMVDVERLRSLWQQSCLELDNRLGCTDAEWGDC